MAVDLSARCIDVCREKFADDDRIVFDVNDGTTLNSIEDDTIDFAFSFDSLVHVDVEVIAIISANS